MAPKLVTLIVAAALTTGWLLASILSPPVAELQGLPERVEPPAPPRDGRADVPFTEQLRLKLHSAPIPPVPRRNPFVFGSVNPRTTRLTVRSAESIPAIQDASQQPVATGPSLRLSGIGSTSAGTATVLTAIISDGSMVHLAKVGETVTGYTVIEITDNAVTIQNAAGKQWILRMQ